MSILLLLRPQPVIPDPPLREILTGVVSVNYGWRIASRVDHTGAVFAEGHTGSMTDQRIDGTVFDQRVSGTVI